jgi:hypothetical protein
MSDLIANIISWIITGWFIHFDDKDPYLEKVLEEGRIRDAALKEWREKSPPL